MKIRNGFVSNSSGSSFVCDICGDERQGYELVDIRMVECENGCIICDDHLDSDAIINYVCIEPRLDEESCPVCSPNKKGSKNEN